ncbi:transporter [Alkalihalobacillus alcalophilus ATCC 27647 = CGMCC 1.3604]|uniref:Transporter n=1 Tax=Alkalihalobacillus alcalophilus ATCC 27647 = CGMCC 1.3604 TaxID=1218173 RepID=J8Q4P8_ALKAL|nr:AEC family transporter [Alkalihalobacillus alcalophilus]AFV25957.1 transporter [Alkalihalobacillus alcalophilus ATCC 27647 = CGMCC 1.3604]KGA98888.1 transporter [Alkalihalobacillus alcalophilus ATCC 27647 = CGMCC 1.3604]MED1560526.1 AEC family transporter [Alkalihalobacillus alcalophilus]THG88920.1 transporter [Alkalihalobacillus alcalophilus ATCC 27647 = CGMCC 1.3604]
MTIFIEVVLPVFMIFAIGFLIQKWRKVDIKPISTVVIYVLTPALVFRTFATSELNIDYFYMVVFALAILLSLIVINKIFSRIKKLDPATESGLILATAFKNAGNYGAPIILFAYGEAGFALAVMYMVLQSIIMNSFGVYYAARGHLGVSVALKTVMLMPATYAMLVALVINVMNIELPDNVFLPINMLAEASIPLAMIILGMQLANIRMSQFEWSLLSYSVITRLILSPIIAFGIALLLPIDPLLQKVLIVSAAMPSAATIVMFAVQFDSKPQFVSTVTFITTVLSLFTITGLLILLG